MRRCVVSCPRLVWLGLVGWALTQGACGTKAHPPAGLDLGPAQELADLLSQDLRRPIPYTVQARIVLLDTLGFIGGIRGYFRDAPEQRSPPNRIAVPIRIPVDTTTCGQPLYLSFDSDYSRARMSIVPMVLVPRTTPRCDADVDLSFVHVVLDDPDPFSIRSTIVRELANHGDIPPSDGVSYDAFSAHWRWALGRSFRVDPAGGEESFYGGGTVLVSTPGTACKVYYLNRYGSFRNGTLPTYVNFAGTQWTAGFLLLCPATQIDEVTLAGAGFTNTKTGAPVTMPPISVPMVERGMASIDWAPTTL